MDNPNLAAMTVNERLYTLGLLERFDAARSQGDAATLRELLERVEVDEPSIERILSSARQPTRDGD